MESATPRQVNLLFVEAMIQYVRQQVPLLARGGSTASGTRLPTRMAGSSHCTFFASDYSANASRSIHSDPRAPSTLTKFMDLQANTDSVDIMYVLFFKGQGHDLHFLRGKTNSPSTRIMCFDLTRSSPLSHQNRSPVMQH